LGDEPGRRQDLADLGDAAAGGTGALRRTDAEDLDFHESIIYREGKFVSADLDKASEENERNGLVIDTEHGRIGVVQVAGLVARRIVCWTTPHSSLVAGERFGLIRFGSRLDVYLPEGFTPRVTVGQTAIAGETVLAEYEAAKGPVLSRRL